MVPGMLDAAFQALADPTRRAVVERLCDGPASVSELAKPFAMTLAAVVQHVQVLEAAGLVAARSSDASGRSRSTPKGLRSRGGVAGRAPDHLAASAGPPRRGAGRATAATGAVMNQVTNRGVITMPEPIAHASFSVERTLPASPAASSPRPHRPRAEGGVVPAVPTVGRRRRADVDIREGGHETTAGEVPGEWSSRFEASYHVIEPDARIVYSYVMFHNDIRLSVSVATIELDAIDDGGADPRRVHGAGCVLRRWRGGERRARVGDDPALEAGRSDPLTGTTRDGWRADAPLARSAVGSA